MLQINSKSRLAIVLSRLEGFEKLLYPLRSSTIELDITTQKKFFDAYGIKDSFSS